MSKPLITQQQLCDVTATKSYFKTTYPHINIDAIPNYVIAEYLNREYLNNRMLEEKMDPLYDYILSQNLTEVEE